MSVKVIGKSKRNALKRRHNRLRKKISGTAEKPRLMVVRSLRHINAMLIDDTKSHTIASASTQNIKAKGTKTEQATEVGKKIAALAKEKKISEVVFDRGGNKYFGRVKAVAEAAREEGLKF